LPGGGGRSGGRGLLDNHYHHTYYYYYYCYYYLIKAPSPSSPPLRPLQLIHTTTVTTITTTFPSQTYIVIHLMSFIQSFNNNICQINTTTTTTTMTMERGRASEWMNIYVCVSDKYSNTATIIKCFSLPLYIPLLKSLLPLLLLLLLLLLLQQTHDSPQNAFTWVVNRSAIAMASSGFI